MLTHLDLNLCVFGRATASSRHGERRGSKLACAIVVALAACHSPCKVDADCGAGGACSRLGNGCLRVAFQQSDFTDLSAWAFDDGGTHSADAGALELVGGGNTLARARHAIDGGVRLEIVTTFAFYPVAGGEMDVGASVVGPTSGAGFDQLVSPLSADVEYRLAMRFADAISYELRRTSDASLVSYSNDIGFSPGFAPTSISYGVKGPGARVELRSLVAAGP